MTLLGVVGPTASGKTELAIRVAEAVGGEIVSCDSAQIYRRLDIGTAKPSSVELGRVRHHLIDVADPDEQWTAQRYAEQADRAIEDIRTRGLVPILCGGAGLWFRALVRGVFAAPPISPEIRSEVRARLRDEGSRAMHEELRRLDPVAAERLHPNDPQRIGRALELVLETGRPISKWQDEHRFASERHAFRGVLIEHGREALRCRIGERTRLMYAEGLVEEARRLLGSGARPDGPSLSVIGYREAVRVVREEIDEETAIELTTVATRQYAKRQLNWFRGEPNIEWLGAPVSTEAALRALEHRRG
ncbi:MAG: tRNA (adenosine(37)-N6)-dimethylallyltransferase MiaA [Deltaproteobacteria bacterium]|nr:tRNA (adenosine(37)-N6)-dimethylallyltransferase MiaA [Deltaproteobacteria bacterium]